ncbi:hypothetical protein AB4Y88_00085 [Paenarthrobacter sp. RAF9]
MTDEKRVDVPLNGALNTFDILVAGSTQSSWTPASEDWVQGNPETYDIGLRPGDGLISPGGHVDLRIAAQNASPRNSGVVSLKVMDPLSRGDAVDPETGRFVELFDQLVFTVREGQTTLMDRVPAAELAAYTWPAQFHPGDVHQLDVRIELPGAVDNRWQGASTDVQFSFQAVSS